ncbi:MAG TPA: PAS domain-containing protein [Chloroflexi bacterium]|nr:PAS domain-containing protein [Chloroflexota bacterium]
MFRLFRFFAIASLFVLAMGALALSILYRQSAVQDLLRAEQDKNVALTRSFANTLWPEFSELLGDSATLSSDDLRNSPAVAALDAALRQQMTNLGIVRVKIYDLAGRTLYSSQLGQIGENQAQNAGVMAAAHGEIVNELTHRDEFNALDGAIENRDVLASYLPLRRSADAEVEAVFELYSDVTALLDDIDRVQWRISASVVVILGILYAALLSVVLYGQRIIRQQYTERTRAELALRRQNDYLSILYATALRVLDRRELDVTLHEILTQTSQIVQADHGVIVLARDDVRLDVVAGIGAFAAHCGQRIALASSITETSFASDKLRVYDWDVIDACDWGAALPPDLAALIAIPLRSRRRVSGLFLLFATAPDALPSPEETDLLAGYVQMASLAVDNASLYQNLQAELEERKRTEATLAASEERMRALVQSMRDVVFTVDLSGRYTGFYGRAIEEYGLLSGSAVGKTPAEVFAPATAQLHTDAIARALANENVVFDWEIATSDAGKVFLQTSLSPVINRTGALSGVVGVGRDYSELKRLEQMKTEFVANVSHELRTPLASILGYTEIVLQGRPGPLNELQQEFLQTILESGKRLKRLVDDLLDVSKIEVGKFRMQFDKTNLTVCLQRALETIEPVAARSDVELTTLLPTTLPTIMADAQRIGQVLDNLLSNAVKYSGSGGSVTVSAAAMEGGVSITVTDSGIGIAAEEIPQLFTRFYRAANVAVSQRTGTGLGLYITKAIIDGHGGHIEVESQSGRGSLFRVWLPAGGDSTVQPVTA